MDFILGIFTGAACLHIVQYIRSSIIRRRVEKRLDDVLDTLRESIINSRIECVNDKYFMYNADTNEFIAQGSDYDELEESARLKYPGKLFNVPKQELDTVKGR